MEDLAIGTPIVNNLGSIPSIPYDYMLKMVQFMSSGMFGINWVAVPSGSLCESRNAIARRYLEVDELAQKILYLDPDTLVEPNTILNIFQTDADIVVPVSIIPNPPFHIAAYNLNDKGLPQPLILGQDFERDEVIPVDVVDLNCAMVKREVLEAIFDQNGPVWFKQCFNEEGKTIPDYFNFCKQAKDLGFKIQMNATVETKRVGHTQYFLEDE